MFAVFQVPLTDVRPFLDEPSHRLAAPAWPIAHLPDDPYKRPFVRGFGSARARPRGGVEEWPAEDAFCDLSHALRFEAKVLHAQRAMLGDEGRSYCAFRRLFWDGQLQAAGSVEGRVEVGFGVRLAPGHAGLEARPFGELLDALLRQRVRVVPPRAAAPMLLSNAGSALARNYLRASTARAGIAALEKRDWWLQAGTPLLIVEMLRDTEVDALPARTVPVAVDTSALSGIRVFLGKRSIEGRERPVWFFECDPGNPPRDALRRLRLNVTRLHAALSSLRILSDLQRTGRIAAAGDAARANLRLSMARYLPLLYQQSYQGYPWTDFLRAALGLSEAMTPGAFATLRALLPNPGRGLNAQLDLAGGALERLQPGPAPAQEWDVFLAHAGPDRAIAEQLAEAIGGRAKVFLDSKSLIPGDNWDLLLPGAQQRSYMTVALIGATYDAAYYLRSEVAAAISMARLDAERHRVVPVYLQGADGRAQAQPYGLNLKHGIEWPQGGSVQAVADRIVDALVRSRALPA
jgi:hypothetical protein